jgi:cation transport ATPase
MFLPICFSLEQTAGQQSPHEIAAKSRPQRARLATTRKRRASSQKLRRERPRCPELRDMQRRFVVSVALTIPLFVIAMAEMLPGDPVGRAVGVAVLRACGRVGPPSGPQHVHAHRRRHRHRVLYSAVATLAPGLFPAAMRGHRGTVDVYFEAAAVITTLVLLGQVLELRARARR